MIIERIIKKSKIRMNNRTNNNKNIYKSFPCSLRLYRLSNSHGNQLNQAISRDPRFQVIIANFIFIFTIDIFIFLSLILIFLLFSASFLSNVMSLLQVHFTHQKYSSLQTGNSFARRDVSPSCA